MTPAYKTLWMSATMPRSGSVPTLVNSFMERHKIPLDTKGNHVKECFSTELDRGALLTGPTGAVAFPHQNITSAEELKKLATRLPGDPLVLKSYTERALASLLTRWQTMEAAGQLLEGFSRRVTPPEEKFADLSELNH